MSNITKKVIKLWDGGMKTSPYDSNPKTSDGAQLISHFDIYKDPLKLKPMPSWTDFATDDEKAYGIQALGGFSSTIYGLGKALNNWYAFAWPYRVKVTMDTTLGTASTAVPLRINLASMPAGFWTHVKSDGSDIRVTDSSQNPIACKVENFDATNHLGDLWIKGLSVTDYVYVYYGNANESSIPIGSSPNIYSNQSTLAFGGSNMKFGFTFGDSSLKNATNQTYFFQSTPVFRSGSFGKAVDTLATNIQTDNTVVLAFSGGDITVSFMVYLTSMPTGTLEIVGDANNTWDVSINSTGHIVWRVVGSSTHTDTSTTALSTGQWYVIDCVYNGDKTIYINKVGESFSHGDGSYVASPSNNRISVNTQNCCYVAQVWGFNSALSSATVTDKYNNLTNASFWTYGSEEAYSSITPVFKGAQIYKKDISGNSWSEYTIAGQPVKTLSYYPVNGFVEDIDGTLNFVLADSEEATGFQYLAQTNTFTLLNPNVLTLGTFTDKSRPTSAVPQDQSVYFTEANSNLGKAGDSGSNDIYTAMAGITSIESWRRYLAIGSTYRTHANVEIWDLIDPNPTETIDAGTGNLRLVGNTQDTLFVVLDNYIDDTILSSNEPAMEIRQYIGNSQTKTIYKMDVPAVYTGWISAWERAVSFFKIHRNTQVLFYAKIPADSNSSTFLEGFWAVGKNSRGQLAISLILDTTDLGSPMNVFGVAQQVFFIQKDGGIKRLDSANAYSKTSLFRTLKMDEGNAQIPKVLQGLEIITDPLDSEQTITIYGKKNGDTERSELMTFSGSGEIAKEVIDDEDGIAFDSYKYMEFDVESVNGGAAIREFNYKYELLDGEDEV